MSILKSYNDTKNRDPGQPSEGYTANMTLAKKYQKEFEKRLYRIGFENPLVVPEGPRYLDIYATPTKFYRINLHGDLGNVCDDLETILKFLTPAPRKQPILC